MRWQIDYSRRARDFIEEHRIEDIVREAIKNFILKITGSNLNIIVHFNISPLTVREFLL